MSKIISMKSVVKQIKQQTDIAVDFKTCVFIENEFGSTPATSYVTMEKIVVSLFSIFELDIKNHNSDMILNELKTISIKNIIKNMIKNYNQENMLKFEKNLCSISLNNKSINKYICKNKIILIVQNRNYKNIQGFKTLKFKNIKDYDLFFEENFNDLNFSYDSVQIIDRLLNFMSYS